MYAGFPLVSERRDGRVYYRFLDSFGLGDVPFTTDEVLALAFSEDLLRVLEGTVFHDSIRSALTKIRASLGNEISAFLARLSDSFRVLPGPHKRYDEARETIQVLNDAVIGRNSVHLRYLSARSGVESLREVDPYRVWYRSGGLYVVGHDHLSGEIRTFAVDRIREIRSGERRFTPPADFDFDTWIAGSFGVVAERPTRVRIRFEASQRTYVSERNWHTSQKLRPRPDGGIDLELEVGATAELMGWILSFGASACVLEPDSLREQIAAELARAASLY
jgi:predicted DNA-binding transcriptional regulator YafY